MGGNRVHCMSRYNHEGGGWHCHYALWLKKIETLGYFSLIYAHW